MQIRPLADPLRLETPPAIRELASQLPRTGQLLPRRDRSGFLQEVESLLLGTEFRDLIFERLTELIDAAQQREDKRFSYRAVAFVTEHGVFLGVERQHGNPPQWGIAEFAASGAVLNAGMLQDVFGVISLDSCQGRQKMFSPSGVGVIEQHLMAELDDAVVITMRDNGDRTRRHRFRKSFCPRTQWEHITAPECGQRTPCESSSLFQLPFSPAPASFDDAQVQTILDRVLSVTAGNANCRRVPPATKEHAAAALIMSESLGSVLVVGPNMRDEQFPNQARCAEVQVASIAHSIAAVRGDNSFLNWPITLVFSPAYELDEDSREHVGETKPPSVCPPCLGLLGEHTPDWERDHDMHERRMLLVEADAQGHIERSWFGDRMPRCFRKAENGVVPGDRRRRA